MSGDGSAVSTCVKYTLFFLNILFWLIGLALLGAGIYARTLKDLGTVFQSTIPWYLDPSIAFIAFGSLTFFIAFLGCIGALRENTCMLKMFEYIIYLILLLELGGAVGLYFAKDKVKSLVKNALLETIPKYRDDADLQSIIDFFQEKVKCCGIEGYNDWDKNIYFNCSSPGTEACGVPYSCCKNFAVDQNTQCGFQVRLTSVSNADRRSKIYMTGCVEATISLVLQQDNMYLLIGIGAGFIILQLVTSGLAHSMITGIRTQLSKQKRNERPTRGIQNTAFN